MNDSNYFKDTWLEIRDRLVAKRLLGDREASLSVRCADGKRIWVGAVDAEQPDLVDLLQPVTDPQAALHAAVYEHRGDVGAIAVGGGPYGSLISGFGGVMPQLFDEQARHIGEMPPPVRCQADLEPALSGAGNALLWRDRPLCMGITSTRLALNVELFEKCAKAFVLAAATGGRITLLPWWVRRIANARLAKDEKRALAAFSRGELPVESSGY
ncbi:hypothetical protein ADIMK_1834 [Marinobacterium lacunae]|uniref:Ribulose-5-phosphate 4-epimerase/Fuculose-1-phosphate aldolase n=1 Tax=Marinobacterium lacunae TaxID=1232683 RepID=A0A081FZZ4_9GAMM|nr:hypothetical protein [Marinobacterium lacunae]KEA64099.1 hypothetical protein ADIMK_1834 [Marinobacterium lacunae]